MLSGFIMNHQPRVALGMGRSRVSENRVMIYYYKNPRNSNFHKPKEWQEVASQPSTLSAAISQRIRKLLPTIVTYRIVASRSMCYYSGNQKFCFLKSRLITCCIFILGTKLFCFSRQKAEMFSILLIQDFMKAHKITAHLDNFYFSEPMLLIEINSISNMP